eukprot:scaffold3365_cov145-Isochrysis_galbana.AAC.1
MEVCTSACQARLDELMAGPRLWPAGEYSAPADDYMLGGRWLFPGGPLPPIGSTAYVDPAVQRAPWIPESYGAPWPRWQEYEGVWQLERFDGSQVDLLTSQGVPWWIRVGFMALGGGIGSVLRIRVLDEGARWITHAYMPGFPAYGEFQRPELGFSTAYIFPVNLDGRGFSTEVGVARRGLHPARPLHHRGTRTFTLDAHSRTATTAATSLGGRVRSFFGRGESADGQKGRSHPVFTAPCRLSQVHPLPSPFHAQVPLLGHERLTGAYETSGPMWTSALAGGGHLAQ